MVIRTEKLKAGDCYASALGISFPWSLLAVGCITNSQGPWDPSPLGCYFLITGKVGGRGTGGFLQSAEFLRDERWGRAYKICHWLAVAQSSQDLSLLSGKKGTFQKLQSSSQLWFGPQLPTAVKVESCGGGWGWGTKNKVKISYNVVLLVYYFQKREKPLCMNIQRVKKWEKHVSFISSWRDWTQNSNYIYASRGWINNVLCLKWSRTHLSLHLQKHSLFLVLLALVVWIMGEGETRNVKQVSETRSF